MIQKKASPIPGFIHISTLPGLQTDTDPSFQVPIHDSGLDASEDDIPTINMTKEQLELALYNMTNTDLDIFINTIINDSKTRKEYNSKAHLMTKSQKIAQAIEHDGMVVGQNDADFLGHAADLWPSSAMRAKIVVPAPTADSMSSVPPINIKRPRMPSSPRPR